MESKVNIIVDAIKINVEIAKTEDGKPIIAEISPNKKSKELLKELIKNYTRECVKASLEKASENAEIILMKNDKYLEFENIINKPSITKEENIVIL